MTILSQNGTGVKPVTEDSASVRQTAYDAVALGFSVVPPREDGSKAPEGRWKCFQSRLPSLEELDAYYGTPRSGVGIVCGKISGDLEVFEFDAMGRLYEPFKARARALSFPYDFCILGPT